MALPNDNLGALHTKVDAFFERISTRHADHMVCGSGCSQCCYQTLSLFPVELDRLEAAVRELDAPARARLRERVAAPSHAVASVNAPCPLLEQDQCIVYAARPTICRSHGAPVRVARTPGSQPERDVCPLNFTGAPSVDELAEEDVIDLERLNTLLSMVNRLVHHGEPRERLDVAILRWLSEAPT